MPLHTIPLCSINYVGETLFSAKFTYDTTDNITKVNLKFLEHVDVNDELVKTMVKCFYKEDCKINKNDAILLKRNTDEIVINSNAQLSKDDIEISVSNGKDLFEDVVEIDVKNYLTLKREDVEILKSSVFELGLKVKELLIKSVVASCEVVGKYILKQSSVEIGKEFLVKDIVGENALQMNNETESSITQIRNVNLDKNMDAIHFNNDSNCIVLEKTIELYFNDVIFNLKAESKNIDRCLKILQMQRGTAYDGGLSGTNVHLKITDKEVLLKESVLRLCRNHDKNIYHVKDNSCLSKDSINELFKTEKLRFAYSNVLKLSKVTLGYNLERERLSHISNINKTSLIYRSITNKIYKNYYNFLSTNNFVSINKSSDVYIDKISLNQLVLINQRYLESLSIFEFNKIYEKYMMKGIGELEKTNDKYLRDDSLDDIDLIRCKNLYDTTIKEIVKNKPLQWFEITRRWWWQKSEGLFDNLIIPNVDFNYSSQLDLLDNKYYEYLRHKTHPVISGGDWGIDNNVPPKGVSIKIMLDVVDILFSIYHKNAQEFSRASGKEAIQFIMEILYDWYTLATSTPNFDYYRAYRWVRWEAEKVYFIYKDDVELKGFEAIGKLVNNLKDYIRDHHYNIVPLCRNPKALDIERMFNRKVAEDIFKPLDKKKGKRHFYIETKIDRRNDF